MPGEQVVGMRQRYMASSGSDTEIESYSRSPPSQAILEHKVAQQERYKGIRYRPELGRYISEIRPAQPRKRKIWLGTYKTAEEAARAFDAGIFYTKKPITYNFEDSPAILEPLPANLTPEQEHIEIQKKAKAAAARVQPSEQQPEVPNPGKYSKYSHSYSSQRSTLRHFADPEVHFVRHHPPTEIQFSAVLNR